MLTDTHCHLFYEQIKNDLESVLERSRKLGVNRFICVATNLNDAEECLELSQRYDCIYASAGIHPHDSKDAPSNFKEKIYDFMKNEKMVALGEMGLDYFRNVSSPKIQKRIFSLSNHIFLTYLIVFYPFLLQRFNVAQLIFINILDIVIHVLLH